MKLRMAWMVILLALAFAAFSCGEITETAGPAPNAVKVEFYVMSQCPYGVQVENTVKPALDQLGKYVDFHLDYIVTETEPGTFKSLHGPSEVAGNIAQLCAKKISPDKYMDFVLCQNKTYRKITENREQCAQQAGIDAAALTECADGEEGKTLLSESAKRAQAAKAKGSPTILVAGKPYRGGRRTDDFLRAFCDAIEGDRPEACANIPPPPKVTAVLLNDKRCNECGPMAKKIQSNLKGVFPGLEVKEIDYTTPEGKALYEKTGIRFLPAVLLDQSVSNDPEGEKRVRRYLTPRGDYKELKIGAKFDPTAEICDNGTDDTGNGKIDCEDPTCKQSLLCRKEIPGRLDVFVMSQCPFGVKALDAMEEVLDNFKGGIDFHINYIASKQGDGFKSLHGQPEVDENIRQLCAIEHYPKDHKYMDYILCRNKDYRNDQWQSCTGENGIKTAVIEKCLTGGEGERLLEENIKAAEAVNVTASPTWLANNKHKFSGIDAETVRKNLCDRNEGLTGCENTLSGPDRRSRGGSCK